MVLLPYAELSCGAELATQLASRLSAHPEVLDVLGVYLSQDLVDPRSSAGGQLRCGDTPPSRSAAPDSCRQPIRPI